MTEEEHDEACIKPPPRFNYKQYFDASHPCFRDTYLYSVFSATVVGLSTFMLTSNTRRTWALTWFTYVGVWGLIWSTCDIRRRNSEFEIRRLSYAVQEYSQKYGTLEGEQKK